MPQPLKANRDVINVRQLFAVELSALAFRERP
jgi:hypothetical protein